MERGCCWGNWCLRSGILGASSRKKQGTKYESGNQVLRTVHDTYSPSPVKKVRGNKHGEITQTQSPSLQEFNGPGRVLLQRFKPRKTGTSPAGFINVNTFPAETWYNSIYIMDFRKCNQQI